MTINDARHVIDTQFEPSCPSFLELDGSWLVSYDVVSDICKALHNGEALHLNRMRQLDPSLMTQPPLAHLCTLAYIKVPGLDADYGIQAATCLAQHANGRALPARIDQRERSASAGPYNRSLTSSPPSTPPLLSSSPPCHLRLSFSPLTSYHSSSSLPLFCPCFHFEYPSELML